MTEHAVESVWQYPRPPRLEATSSRVRVVHCGIEIAESTRAYRVLETSHPPVYYIPQGDVAMKLMKPSARRGSFCEFKGIAAYWSLELPELPDADTRVVDVAWGYPRPTDSFAAIRDHLAFYASKLDECSVDGEVVQAQPGDFYGGWITSWVKGPFKGSPGTMGW